MQPRRSTPRLDLVIGVVAAAMILVTLLIVAGFVTHWGSPGVSSGSASQTETRSPGVVGSTSPYVTASGTQFTWHGQPLRLYGCTFYPALAGGSAAWHKASFPQYIDQTLNMAAHAGQNLIRPTDFWDKSTAGQTMNDPQVWSNMDYLINAAKQRGMFVIMDLSAYKWLLTSQGKDPYSAANWSDYLDFVGARYQSETAIAFYSIVGEPPTPKTPDASNQMVAFYRTVTDMLYAADHGRHLITAGGFNHMEDETPATPWWHQIFALPHNDVVAFKTYSQHDIDLMPTIAAYAQQLHKPMTDEEFGMPQFMGDSAYAGGGVVYNGITTSRATFFATVYSTGERLGITSFVFWNLGCEIKSSGYEVSPSTPAVWSVIQQHAPVALSTQAPNATC